MTYTFNFYEQKEFTQERLFKGFEIIRQFPEESTYTLHNKRTGAIEKRCLKIEELEAILIEFNLKYDLNLDFYKLGYTCINK